MPNIILTDYCNQSCPYCFAKKMMDGDNGNIDFALFSRIIDYLVDNGEKRIGIIGGEPTLHPEFLKLIDYAVKRAGLVHLFTNGMVRDEVVRGIGAFPEEKLTVLVNLNAREFYTDKQLAKIERTLSAMGHRATLGYTIHSESFSLEFHREMIVKHGLRRHLRLGLASPIAGSDKGDFLKSCDQVRLAGNIVAAAELLEEQDILIEFDCGFFYCLFTTEQLGILTEKTLGFHSSCKPVIDIDMEGLAHRCFPTTGVYARKIFDYPDISALRSAFNRKFDGLKILGKEGKCFDCKFLSRGQCGGGCVGRTLCEQPDLLPKLSMVS